MKRLSIEDERLVTKTLMPDIQTKLTSPYPPNWRNDFARRCGKYRKPLVDKTIKHWSGKLDSDDAAQNTLIRADKICFTYPIISDSDQTLTGWIFRIHRNVCYEMWNSKFFQWKGERTSKPTEFADSLDQPDPETGLNLSERIDQQVDLVDYCVHSNIQTYNHFIAPALAKLPEDQRVLITLYYVNEFSYETIANKLSLPLGTVKSRLNRARIFIIDECKKNKDRDK